MSSGASRFAGSAGFSLWIGALFLPKIDPTSWCAGIRPAAARLRLGAKPHDVPISAHPASARGLPMFRQLLPPCACLALAFGVVLSAAPAPAWSQDGATQERLDRLERDINMLQRQVYGGAPARGIGGGGGAAVNTEIRMDRVEAQMRDLTGRVEEFVNQIEQMRQRVEQVNSDTEMRLGQAPARSGPLAAANPAPSRPGAPAPGRPTRQFPAPPGGDDEDLAPMRQGPWPGTATTFPEGPFPGEPAPGGPTPIFGTLTPPASPAPSGSPANPAPGYPPARGVLPGGSATEQYNYAFGLLKQADYPAAEAALKAFVEQHPRDPMAGNAQYWLGETYYTRANYLEAASAFAEGYKRYPKSAKAADNLLKLGMSLGRANQKPNACLALAQLDRDFPNPGASVKERAAAEKKRLGC
jgi:tol-pal system protein YbgF